MLNAHSRDPDLILSWGAIIHQCSCTHKEYFLFPIHRETIDTSDIPSYSETWNENSLHSRLWAMNVATFPTSKVLCPKWWQDTKKTPVCEAWYLLWLQTNQLCDQNWKFSYREITPEVVRTSEFCFQEQCIDFPLQMTLQLEDRISFNSVYSGTTICIITNCQPLNKGYLGFLTLIAANKGMICVLQLWPL